MTDLTKIDKPFGLLDLKTQEALRLHKAEGGSIEVFTGAYFHLIGPKDSCAFWRDVTYRAKPAPLTKPSINWSVLDPEWRWLARDENEEAWVFTDHPTISHPLWVCRGKEGAKARKIFDLLASYTPGTCDWRDSLVERPEGV